MTKPVIFWLGATGYVGSEALLALNQYLPQPDSHHIVALVRDATPEKISALQHLYSDLEVVKGTLDDGDLITKTAKQSDVLINTADSLHPASIAILAGLTARAKSNASTPAPIYVHISGISIISDRCNGVHVEHPKEWSDKDLDVTKCVYAFTTLAQ